MMSITKGNIRIITFPDETFGRVGFKGGERVSRKALESSHAFPGSVATTVAWNKSPCSPI